MNRNSVNKKKEGFSGQKAVVLPRKILTERCASNKIIANLYITDMGYYPHAQHHYRDRSHGAIQHILIYCHDGKGSFIINGRKHEVEPGEFFIIPAKTPHTYMADADIPWSIFWIHFTGNTSYEIALAIRQSTGGKGFLKNSKEAIHLFGEMYAHLERGYGSDNLVFANMCLWQFFTTFMFNDKYSTSKTETTKDDINKAIEFMRQHLSETLSVNAIASYVNLSTSHFTYQFKHKTGFSPIEYFNHLKIQEACQYLLFTQMRMKEIALELGFDDPHYFSRLFTKVMGLSPASYRQKRTTH